MKANKVKIKIDVSVLSIDSVPILLLEVIERIRSEFSSGKIIADDGDQIKWKTKIKAVKF
ncbi:MAG: hypothetical protein WC554_04270 [Clostridia bacterium]